MGGDVNDGTLRLFLEGAQRASLEVVWNARGGDLGACCTVPEDCDPDMSAGVSLADAVSFQCVLVNVGESQCLSASTSRYR